MRPTTTLGCSECHARLHYLRKVSPDKTTIRLNQIATRFQGRFCQRQSTNLLSYLLSNLSRFTTITSTTTSSVLCRTDSESGSQSLHVVAITIHLLGYPESVLFPYPNETVRTTWYEMGNSLGEQMGYHEPRPYVLQSHYHFSRSGIKFTRRSTCFSQFILCCDSILSEVERVASPFWLPESHT